MLLPKENCCTGILMQHNINKLLWEQDYYLICPIDPDDIQ